MVTNFTRPALMRVRRPLRRTMTSAEVILWSHLRARKVAGCRFRRQHSLDGIVFDFYAAECLLAIEVDGGIHNSDAQRARDESRTRHASRFGIVLLRFTNDEVRFSPRAVVATIERTIADRREARSRHS